MPSALKDNPFLVDVMGWTFGSNPLVNLIPGNHFSIGNYAGNKLLEAGQKAWQTGNIWEFFNYNFYHISGYSNFLENMWGGNNIKWLLDNLAGIDPDGNMSVANFLLNLATIIPIGRLASVGGKLLARYLPKAAGALMKSGTVQFLLKNKAVQTVLKGAKNYLVDPLSKIGKNILNTIPNICVI